MLLNPAKEQSLSITKDTEVEVCSLEEGFHGAWYRAILEDSPTISGRKKLRVRYTTLINDDYSTPLTETVEQSFIRPIPPGNSDSDEDFEEGSLVDVDLKDGWWEGIVIKKIENERFLVYFDSPPDLIEFEKKELRTHFDWIDSKWIKPENKVLSKSSMFSCGTMVEVNCKIDQSESVWVPAIVVKDIEIDHKKKLIVKCCNKSLSFNGEEAKPNITVDSDNVRPIPPSFFVDVYKLLDRVEAFNGLGWRKGLVREILSKKRYKVSFLATKDESVFQHSDLRPAKEWEDGVWHHGTKRKETLSDGTTLSEFTGEPKKLKIKLRSSMAEKPITPTPNLAGKTECETKLVDKESTTRTPLAREPDKMADDAMNCEATPIEIPLESSSPITADVNATPVKETEPETQEKITSSPEKKTKTTYKRKLTAKRSGRKPKKMQKRNSNLNKTGSKEAQSDDHIHEEDDEDQTLATWLLAEKFDKSKLSSDETRANEDITMPFLKRSQMWKDIESMEAFKLVPQMPHFKPLFHTKEEFREGVAMGKMVTFSTLLDKVKNLKLNVSRTELKRLKDCFNELEKYGFNVGLPLSRIDTIFGLKEKQASVVKERKEKEKEIKEEVKKKSKVEEDLKDVERKIIELRDQESGLKTKIEEMELCVLDFDKKIEDVEVEFQKIVEAPW